MQFVTGSVTPISLFILCFLKTGVSQILDHRFCPLFVLFFILYIIQVSFNNSSFLTFVPFPYTYNRPSFPVWNFHCKLISIILPPCSVRYVYRILIRKVLFFHSRFRYSVPVWITQILCPSGNTKVSLFVPLLCLFSNSSVLFQSSNIGSM